MEVFVSCPEFKIYMSGVTLQSNWRVTPNTYYYSEKEWCPFKIVLLFKMVMLVQMA